MTELASPRHAGGARLAVATKPDDIINVTSHHTVPEEEKRRFVEYVNSVLRDDPDVKHLVPVDPTSMAFFEAAKDGILLIKLINSVIPNTVDMKKVHKGKNLTRFNVVENLNHVINGAKKIGVNLVNIGVVDLEEGKPHLVLGLVWQIVKIRLVNDMALKISANDSATLRNLKNNPTEVLIAWVNECLKKAGSNKQIKNLSSDITDSEVYTILLNHLAPKVCTKAPLNEKDPIKRAELMLQEADKVKVRKFVSPSDVVEGNGKLNFAFVANIFASLKEISDADRAVVPAPAPVVQTRSETEHLETTIARLKKEIEDLKARLTEAEKNQADMAKKYNDKCVENQQLLAKLAQLESALASKQNEELNSLKRAIDGASKEKEDLLKRIRELEEQLAALQKKFEPLKKENAELTKALDTAEGEIKRLDATVLRLDKELDERDDNVRELLRQLLELKGRFDTNENRLKKYVYEEYTRNETVREKQGKSVNITLKDAKIGAPMHGWLTIQSLADELTWKKRYFVLKDNHLFLYRTDKDTDNEGKTLHIIAGSKVETVGDFVVKTREEIRKEKKKARKAKEKAEKEKEKGKKKKKTEKEKKEKKTPKNRLHHHVFTLASPDLGDLNPGLLFRFAAESDQDMETWARFIREAVKALPDVDQVYYFVVPEAKAAAEAEKRRQTIAAPGKREHAQTSASLPRPEGIHHEHHEHHEHHHKDDDSSDVISDSSSSSSSSSSS